MESVILEYRYATAEEIAVAGADIPVVRACTYPPMAPTPLAQLLKNRDFWLELVRSRPNDPSIDLWWGIASGIQAIIDQPTWSELEPYRTDFCSGVICCSNPVVCHPQDGDKNLGATPSLEVHSA